MKMNFMCLFMFFFKGQSFAYFKNICGEVVRKRVWTSSNLSQQKEFMDFIFLDPAISSLDLFLSLCVPCPLVIYLFVCLFVYERS